MECARGGYPATWQAEKTRAKCICLNVSEKVQKQRKLCFLLVGVLGNDIYNMKSIKTKISTQITYSHCTGKNSRWFWFPPSLQLGLKSTVRNSSESCVQVEWPGSQRGRVGNGEGPVLQLMWFTKASGGGFIYFYFHHCLGKISHLTNIFQMGWNHQPERHQVVWFWIQRRQLTNLDNVKKIMVFNLSDVGHGINVSACFWPVVVRWLRIGSLENPLFFKFETW